MSEPLDSAERERRTELEAVIEHGLRSFDETGRALREMRDSRLYKDTHDTFESYCAERWRISRSQAYRLIDAAAVVELVSPTGDTPANEAVARELVALQGSPDELRETWRRAVAEHGSHPTAAQVRATIRGISVVDDEPVAGEPAEPRRTPEQDPRFEMVEDAVAILQMLPAPEDFVFPEDPGDVEAFDEAIRWLADWAPRVSKAWGRRRASSRRAA